MSWTHRLIVGLLAIATSLLAAEAQEPTQTLPETRLVLCVSGKFIQGLLGDRFQRDEPIGEDVNGIAVTGAAHVAGEIRVRLRESETESNFDVLVRGSVSSQLTATSPPVTVLAHGTAPFCARLPIVHQDHQFAAQPLTLGVRNHFTLDEIRSDRGGLTGAFTRQIARPFVRRGLTDGDVLAEDKIRTRMTPVMETEFGKLVELLNKIPPLVKKAHELIILEYKAPPNGLRFYRAATKERLLISIGGPNRRLPDLPKRDAAEQGPVELWIGVSKNEDKEERRKFLVENWRLITPFFRDQLQRRSPQLTREADEPLAKLLDEVQIREVPGWHVLMFGPRIRLPSVETR